MSDALLKPRFSCSPMVSTQEGRQLAERAESLDSNNWRGRRNHRKECQRYIFWNEEQRPSIFFGFCF